MPNANTHKVGRTPMGKRDTYAGPIVATEGLVYFNCTRADQRPVRVGSKPSKLSGRMRHWESQGWDVRAEK